MTREKTQFDIEIGEFLLKARNKQNFSGELAGDYVNVSRTVIYRYENGVISVPFATLLRLLSFYRTDIYELIESCPTVKNYTIRGFKI